jgi:hypothetical protein
MSDLREQVERLGSPAISASTMVEDDCSMRDLPLHGEPTMDGGLKIG